MEINNIVAKQVGKLIYLGSVKYYGGKINGEINKKVQNSSKFYKIMKGILWDTEIPK
jgi:hypothetical protein